MGSGKGTLFEATRRCAWVCHNIITEGFDLEIKGNGNEGEANDDEELPATQRIAGTEEANLEGSDGSEGTAVEAGIETG